ncbi:glycosyltransferase family 4 protein [Pontibacter sp. G13]|uniref:glycosyltransferase family 4 protein n=1 Tax=Pontibacter sp. G13 TaxID=3074898 RepID=UPI00288A6E99|nr:glycosyltransferase family 4 protein [Pontibacter sp. G13]WNJ19268.1 glycosyltransferase family 4 protein [Pontibacter sp. G13]
MKIALFTDGIQPFVIGGMQTHSFQLAKHLTQLGVMVDLYHTGEPDEQQVLALFSESERAYLTVHHIPFPKSGKYPGHYIRESYQFSKRIWRAFLNQGAKADLIYAQGFTGWHGLMVRNKGIHPPICVNLHGLEMYQTAHGFSSKLAHAMLRIPAQFLIRNADFHHSLGGSLTDILEDQGADRAKIWELPNGVKPEWFQAPAQPNESGRSWVFLGRYELRKGIELLNETLPDILAGTDIQFTFIGPIPDEHRINHPHVHYTGMVREFEVLQKYLAQADWLVCPSLAEGMPTVILEAMASRCGIIATDVGATRLLVDHEVGFLIPPSDLAALSGALRQAADLGESEITHIQDRAFRRAKHQFAWPVIAETLVEQISQTLSISGPSNRPLSQEISRS